MNSFDPKTGEVDDAPVLEGEIVEPIGSGVLATIHRVEIDQQVATAKAYPRSVVRIKQELTALVTMDEDTADDCIYALPRGGKHIKGPSANFADALISFWGNARSGSYVVQVDRENGFIEAIGTFQDVERNVIRARRVRRGILDRHGRVYNADMILMTGNAAGRIAERNAILNGIPKSLWGPAYEQAFALVAGTTKTLSEKLARAEKAFAVMGITMDQVLQKIERADTSKVLPDDIVTMRGMLTALKSGEETVETIFGRGAGGHQHETVKNPLKDEPKLPRGAALAVQDADRVIEKDGTISKDRGDRPADPTKIVDKRDPISSGPIKTETASNSVEKIDMASKAVHGGAEKVKDDRAADLANDQKNAPAAISADPDPKKQPDKPYHDGPSYIAYMHDRFDTAKVRSVITELWGSTRGDRNEFLTQDEIDELGKDKDAKIAAFKAKE